MQGLCTLFSRPYCLAFTHNARCCTLAYVSVFAMPQMQRNAFSHHILSIIQRGEKLKVLSWKQKEDDENVGRGRATPAKHTATMLLLLFFFFFPPLRPLFFIKKI